MSGWIAIKRDIHGHPIFHQNPERLFVWTWILATAAWRDTRMDANGTTVMVKRGQLLTSYRQISKATGVGVQVIRTLVSKLIDENAINTALTQGRLLITICNYEKYQSPNGSANTFTNTGATQDQHTKEPYNHSAKADASKSASKDLKKIAFDGGVRLLSDAGKSEAQARAIVGKWVKQNGEAMTIEALGKAQREGAIDPVSFVEGVFRHANKNHSVKPGQASFGHFGNGEVVR